jgi:hypothetical protein
VFEEGRTPVVLVEALQDDALFGERLEFERPGADDVLPEIGTELRDRCR